VTGPRPDPPADPSRHRQARHPGPRGSRLPSPGRYL